MSQFKITDFPAFTPSGWQPPDPEKDEAPTAVVVPLDTMRSILEKQHSRPRRPLKPLGAPAWKRNIG